jgi:exopolysaccharide biosynthesis WecB/TagA/CpsF family protein
MYRSAAAIAYPTAQTPPGMPGRKLTHLASDLLPLGDFFYLLLAGLFSSYVMTHWLAPLGFAVRIGEEFHRAGLVVAVLAPFMLYDKRFGPAASHGRMVELVRSHALRFSVFAGVVLLLGGLIHARDAVPYAWLAVWLSASLLLTSLGRVVVAQYLRHLQRRGRLSELIAVVGDGPVADRLVQALRQARPASIELLGVFDDAAAEPPEGTLESAASLTHLIELGKHRRIDWILLALPPTAEQRILSVVQRLKALSVPIGLCPQHVGLSVPCHAIDYVADSLPVSLLADHPIKRWNLVAKRSEDYLPRWVITLATLPLLAIAAISDALIRPLSTVPRRAARKPVFHFDNYDVAGFARAAAGFGQEHYGYAVTPNADHLIRLHEDAAFRALYDAASYVLLDSRFLAHVLRITRGLRLPVCTGSDLTATLLSSVIQADDPLVLLGGSVEQARQLRERYGLRHLAHFNPPMGFIRDPAAVESCLRFIEDHSPFRFCLLAVGAPQQEVLAEKLKARGRARGLALCIGASINFLTGDERRAPLWMQRCGLEWSYRLLRAPARMGKRYLIRGPRVFGLLHAATIVLRPVARTASPSPPTTIRRPIVRPAAPPIGASSQRGPALVIFEERRKSA